MLTDMIALLKPILTATPERWHQLVNTVPYELLTRQPAPEEWSALECLHHLVDGERLLFPHRIRQIQANPGMDLDGFDPNFYEYPKENPAELAATFSRLRQKNLQLLEQISESDLALQAKHPHPEFGDVTLAEILYAWPGHDLNHTAQAERAIMQFFLPSAGPWHIFLHDHAPTVLA